MHFTLSQFLPFCGGSTSPPFPGCSRPRSLSFLRPFAAAAGRQLGSCLSVRASERALDSPLPIGGLAVCLSVCLFRPLLPPPASISPACSRLPAAGCNTGNSLARRRRTRLAKIQAQHLYSVSATTIAGPSSAKTMPVGGLQLLLSHDATVFNLSHDIRISHRS